MSSIGNINNAGGVAYTDLTGLNLSSSTQDQVQIDAAVSDGMATDITNALAEFRAEGNFNPTAAEMEAKLSSVGAAAKQASVNQLQHLIFGVQQALQIQIAAGKGDANETNNYGFALQGEVTGGSSNISKYFGDQIGGGGDWSFFALLGQNGIDTSSPSFIALGSAAHAAGGCSNAQLSSIISQLQTKLSQVQSQPGSSFASQNVVAGGLTAHQWLAKEMGVDNPKTSYSLTDWGNIAEKLKVHAAKLRSELSIGSGGGIQQVNGQYFVNGQEMSLSQINFCVRANQYQLIDQQIADQLDAIQSNSQRAKKVQAVLAAFKTWDGEKIGVDQSATQDLNSMMNSSAGGWGVVQHYLNTNFGVTDTSSPNYLDYATMMCENRYSGDPSIAASMKATITEFFSLLKTAAPSFYSSHITDNNGGPPFVMTGTISNSDFSDLKTSFGTYLQSNSTDKQVAQQRLDALNNTRQAVLTGMSAFTQGQSQSTERITGNL